MAKAISLELCGKLAGTISDGALSSCHSARSRAPAEIGQPRLSSCGCLPSTVFPHPTQEPCSCLRIQNAVRGRLETRQGKFIHDLNIGHPPLTRPLRRESLSSALSVRYLQDPGHSRHRILSHTNSRQYSEAKPSPSIPQRNRPTSPPTTRTNGASS